jgi:Protein of unknown function, DUF624
MAQSREPEWEVWRQNVHSHPRSQGRASRPGLVSGSASGSQHHFGEGPLARLAALVYTLLVVELLLLVTSLPGLVPLVLLDRDASNIPLAAACAVPLGPALSAAVYALHHRSGDLADLEPAAAFLRGYRANFLGSLQVWLPWLAWLTIVAVNLAHFAAAGVPGWWGVLLVVVAFAATLCAMDALVITSLFAFRPLDVVRLAAAYLSRTPGVTLGNACLLVAAAGITAFTSEAVVALLGSVLAALLLRTCRPMIAEIQRDFTR